MSLRRNRIGLFALCIFASVSVLGQGLHFVPGANHFAAESHACDHCQHHGATAPDSDTTSSDTTSTHDCPICSLLAQAQFQTEFCVEQPLTHSCELLDDRQPLGLTPSIVALHLARAPPSAS